MHYFDSFLNSRIGAGTDLLEHVPGGDLQSRKREGRRAEA